ASEPDADDPRELVSLLAAAQTVAMLALERGDVAMARAAVAAGTDAATRARELGVEDLETAEARALLLRCDGLLAVLEGDAARAVSIGRALPGSFGDDALHGLAAAAEVLAAAALRSGDGGLREEAVAACRA